MTLIISEISWKFAIQVSDRLVNRGGIPFDPLANKSLVYVAPDGLLTLAHTGRAFLGEVPTDQWIAQKLAGFVYAKGETPSMVRIKRVSPWRPVGVAVRYLANELSLEFARLGPGSSSEFFEILGSGWRWKANGRYRPILFGIRKQPGSMSIEPWWSPRLIGRRCILAVTPPNHGEERLSLKSIYKSQQSARSLDDVELTLVDAVRKVAKVDSTVGFDSMSVILLPPPFLKGRIRYLPLASGDAVMQRDGAGEDRATPIAFSPWIIGRGGVHAPSILSGTCQIGLGPFTLSLDAPEPPGPGLRFATWALPRPNELGIRKPIGHPAANRKSHLTTNGESPIKDR